MRRPVGAAIALTVLPTHRLRTCTGAVLLRAALGLVIGSAKETGPRLGRSTTVLATAMRLEGRGTVRARDPEVLEAVVIRFSVDVIKDQGHSLPPPDLALTAKLAGTLLDPFLKEPILELAACDGRACHQEIGKLLLLPPTYSTEARCPRIEMRRVDPPDLRVFLQCLPVATSAPVLEVAKGTGPAVRCLDRRPELLLGEPARTRSHGLVVRKVPRRNLPALRPLSQHGEVLPVNPQAETAEGSRPAPRI